MIFSFFKKAGGFELLKHYFYNHILFYAFFCFLILPKNKKGFELLRECVNTKLYLKLKNKNKKILQNSNCAFENSEDNKIIWFCWFQGLENAPEIVKTCYKSLQKNLDNYKIQIITSFNYSDFTDLPDFIIQKWKLGIITNTHFSDILRTNLLVKNGGIWIDSTCFVTNKIPSDIEKSSLFLFRTFKPGSDGKGVTISSWFFKSCKNHPILRTVQDLIFNYWKKHNFLCDYFLFHNFVQMSLEKYSDFAEKIPKYTNETPHFLLFELKNEFDEEKYKSLLSQSFIHKLTYKLDFENDENNDNSFYKRILDRNN